MKQGHIVGTVVEQDMATPAAADTKDKLVLVTKAVAERWLMSVGSGRVAQCLVED